MLRLPRLDVCRNEYSEASLLVAIRKQLQEDDAKRDNGIHASDLLDLRLAYWRNTNPKEVDERTAFFFVIGKVLHTLVLSLADPMITASDAGTKNELGISYSPDLVSRAGRPTELKSNRATDEPDDLQEEYSHYLEQLIIYMICENMLTGELWILYLNLREASSRRTFPALRWPERRDKPIETDCPKCAGYRENAQIVIQDLNHRLDETRSVLEALCDALEPTSATELKEFDLARTLLETV